MKYDMQLLWVLVGIGLWKPKLNFRGWLYVTMFVFAWIIYCWLRA